MYDFQTRLSYRRDQLAAFIAACLILVLTSFVLLCTSCENSTQDITDPEVTARAIMNPAESGVYPFESEDPATGVVYTGMLYTTQHEFGMDAVQAGQCNRFASPYITILENQNYTLSLSRCKYIETTIEIDNLPVSTNMTFLVFQQTTDDPDVISYGSIRITRLRGIRDCIQFEKLLYALDPWLYWTYDDGYVDQIGYDYTDQGDFRPIWMKSYQPHIQNWLNDLAQAPMHGTGTVSNQDAWDENRSTDDNAWESGRSFDWDAWLLCTVEGAAAGCAAASATCMFSSGPYNDCFGEECAGAAIGSAIGCAARQLF